MTSGSSSNFWLDLSGSEPDLYYPSAASALSGSCRTPEEIEPQWMVVQQFSQLSIGDQPLDVHGCCEDEPAYTLWDNGSFGVDQALSLPQKPFSEMLPLGRGIEQRQLSRSQRQMSTCDAISSSALMMPTQHVEVPPRRVRSNIHLPSTNTPAQLQPSVSYACRSESCIFGHEAMEILFEQAQQQQDELMADVRMFQSNLSHVHAEIDDIQSNQSEHSEDVAAAWQERPRQWLPLN